MKSFKQKSIFSKVTTIFGILILAIALYVAYLMISFSISSSLEKSRYEKIATNLETVIPALNKVSGDYTWTSSNTCNDTNNYAIGSPNYICSAKLTLTFNTDDPKLFLDLNNKYRQVLDSQDSFKQTSSYKEYPVTKIGKELVVSLAEQNYESEAVPCLYFARLNQTDEKARYEQSSYGVPIVGGQAEAQYTLWCTDKTMGAWYDVVDR